MSKKIIYSLILFFVFAVAPISADVNSAVGYLQTQSLDDWSAQALVSAGVTVTDEDWLQDFTANEVTAVEKRVLTLTALDKDPASYYVGRNLITEISQHNFHNNQIGDEELLNDDMFAVLALASANQTNLTAFSAAAQFIADSQNADGGWSYAVGQPSDTNDTAIAIMALTEVGYQAGDSLIDEAINYLLQAKNLDNGWGFTAGSESDSASTAWVISALTKVGVEIEDESYAWLNSLQTADGSFKWLPSDQQGSQIMTSYAVIALSGKYFPVKKLPATQPGNYLRLEGSRETYCQGYFTATTALAIVEEAAQSCGYTYEIEETSFGPYLKKVNGDEAVGMIGWMYRVNWQSPMVGANDYVLQPGDEVLWYFGDWQWRPSRLSVSTDSLEIGEELRVKAEYLDDDSDWQPLAGATVTVGGQTYITDAAGEAIITFSQVGSYSLQAQADGFIRSNTVIVTVGNGLSEAVAWRVEIEDDSKPTELSFQVITKQIDFGRLKPGQSRMVDIQVQNDGVVPVYIEAVASGNQELIDNLKLNGLPWSEFNKVISAGAVDVLAAKITIPDTFAGSGIASGDIIFWGTGAN